MIVRELLTSIGYVVNRRTEKTARQSFSGIKQAAQNLGLALSAGALVQGFRTMVNFASDAEETMNVVTTAFENQAQAVLGWAAASGEAAGRSEYAMREYASALGAVVGPTLGSAEATADLSTNMAQLAVDLGSFFNATDQEALDAIRAGLIGSSEPMLRFGVNMNVAALDAFALSEGLGKTTKQMNEAEKTMLRYRFIMARTTKAQGDAAKTSDGFANQLKRLGGNLRNVATDIGKEFLGGAAGLLQMLNRLIASMRGPMVLAAKAVGNAFKFIQAIVIGLWETFKEIGFPLQALLVGLLIRTLALHAPWILWGVLIAAAVGGAIAILDDLWMALTTGEGVLAGLLNEFTFWLNETDSIFESFKNILLNALDFWWEFFTGTSNVSDKISEAIVGTFIEIDRSIREVWQGMVDAVLGGMLEIVGFVSDKLYPIINRVMNFGSAIGGLASKFLGGLGDLDKTFGVVGPSKIAAPGSPLAGGDLNSQQTIEVNVNAPGGDGPGIARAVAPAVGRAASDGTRRVAQQLLAGGAS